MIYFLSFYTLLNCANGFFLLLERYLRYSPLQIDYTRKDIIHHEIRNNETDVYASENAKTYKCMIQQKGNKNVIKIFLKKHCLPYLILKFKIQGQERNVFVCKLYLLCQFSDKLHDCIYLE